MAARELELVTGLVELDRTSLRERAMTMLRNALAAREIPPGTPAGRDGAVDRDGHLPGDPARGACASWSTRVWSRWASGAG